MSAGERWVILLDVKRCNPANHVRFPSGPLSSPIALLWVYVLYSHDVVFKEENFACSCNGLEQHRIVVGGL